MILTNCWSLDNENKKINEEFGFSKYHFRLTYSYFVFRTSQLSDTTSFVNFSTQVFTGMNCCQDSSSKTVSMGLKKDENKYFEVFS